MNLHLSTRLLSSASLAAALVFALGACTSGGGKTTPDGATPSSLAAWSQPAALTSAQTCDDALGALASAAVTQMDLNLEQNRLCFLGDDGCHWYRGGPWMEGDMGAPSAGGDDAADAPNDYSETNTQVAGVDEADRVKTDGTHLYTLSGEDLVVLKSWPAAETDELGRVRLRGNPSAFYLDGDRAVVLGYANLYDFIEPPATPEPTNPGEPTEPAEPDASDGSDGAAPPADDEAREEGDYEDYYNPYHYRSVTYVAIVDLSDRANPAVTRELLFDGYSLDTRRIDDKVYLAQNVYVSFNDLEYWPNDLGEEPSADEVNAAFDAMRTRNIERIANRTLTEWLPRYWSVGADGEVSDIDGASVSACNDVYLPSAFSGQNLLTLVTFDAATGAVSGSTIQGEWGNVYASTDALYIGSTNWNFFWWWQDSEDQPEIATHIHKFAFDTQGRARYVASGEVLGYAINQFAFDEHEGYLRVATTDGMGWWNNEEMESRVTVLEQVGGALEQVGLVAGLGVGERIYSVRFMGEQGYVVTFMQIDPLYVLDLRDPTEPKVTGELKIPGFSSYIHPMGDGYLLTVGRDGDDEGNVGGVKVEVFDVTDPTAPKSVTTSVLGDGWSSWSDALWDHKAFNYFAARDLLAIPVSGWEETSSSNGWYGEYRSVLALFRVTPTEVTPVGEISHMDLLADYGANDACYGYNGYWQAQISRSTFADDYVYSLSTLGVVVHDTRDLAAGPVAEITLLDPEYFQGYGWDYCGVYTDDGEPTDSTEPDGGEGSSEAP